MDIPVNGHALYAYTGGKPFDPAQPTVVFIHGVLNDHSVWILQSRHFAHHGWNVLAIDLPGQGRSKARRPPASKKPRKPCWPCWTPWARPAPPLVGHSFGCTIALEAAARACRSREPPGAVRHGLPDEGVARAAGQRAERARKGHPHGQRVLAQHAQPAAFGPGPRHLAVRRQPHALMRRMLASNREVNVFHTGFKACDGYAGGEKAMAAVQCPTLFVIGAHDQMTPPRIRPRAGQVGKAAGHCQVNAGHSMMTEAPGPVLDALRAFLAR